MLSRRRFLNVAGSGLMAAPLAGQPPARGERKKMAIVTTGWRYMSHAWRLGGRFLPGYRVCGQWHRPPLDVVAAYVDQKPADDLSKGRARENGFTIYPTIAEALRCGGKRLAVDAVLIIGEHGNYPTSKWGQRMYPR